MGGWDKIRLSGVWVLPHNQGAWRPAAKQPAGEPRIGDTHVLLAQGGSSVPCDATAMREEGTIKIRCGGPVQPSPFLPTARAPDSASGAP